MLTIVVPMAGLGSRFAVAGYTVPKPLIPIHGRPMIRLVIENLRPSRPHRFVFICQRTHAERFELADKFAEWCPGSAMVLLDGVTEGAACTVLAARHLIADDQPLMIANSDQYVDTSIDAYLDAMDGLDGMIMTMTANDPKWSFARLGPDGLVREVVEKKPVSDEATVGIYNFRRGDMFTTGADAMIAADLRVNGEFYVAPVYNQLIAAGGRVAVHNIGAEADGMYGLGTPADLELFVGLELSRRVAGAAPCG